MSDVSRPSDPLAAAAGEVQSLVSDLREKLGLEPTTEPSALEDALTAATDKAAAIVEARVRPSAAEIAAKRPATAEPKAGDAPAKVTIVASGEKVSRSDGLDAMRLAFEPGRQTKGPGKEYLLDIPIEGLNALGQDPVVNASIMASAFAQTQKARTEGTALTAAFCSPPEPIYDRFPSISSATAGVLDLPEVTANRGAVYISATPTVFGLSSQTGIGSEWDGVSSKGCYTIACADPNLYSTTATFTCINAPNFLALYNPELYQAYISEAQKAHAQNVNRRLLDDLEDISVPIGDPGTGGGAIVSVFRAVALTAGWYRARYKADLRLALDVVFPSWVADVLEADAAARDSTTQYGVGLNGWINALRRLNVTPQFVYGYQESPSAPTPPTQTNWFLFASGAVARLRGREFSLGQIRDSVNNAANLVGFFAESWEGLARSVGLDVIEVEGTQTCATGATADRVSISCETGS